ncbi:serine hydrolase [Aeromicrobium panaciterrae]|uniref:serine hydrolase n=1 Tax=Aeromicrobium panaciterrae TaxID=363861 RepID=UPI0031E1848F
MVTSWTFWVVGLVMSGAVASSAIAADTQDSQAAAPVTATSTAPATTSTSNTLDLSSLADIDGTFSVAVRDVATGESVSYGTGSYDTASIVKVDIVAALLHQAQEQGRTLTTRERTLAEAAIERSDNASATALFQLIGGEAGLEEFNRLIGLTDTDVGSNGNWGLTQTTAVDQIRLLQVVFGGDSVLTSESQAYEQSLMADVIDTQRFGVSAAADDAAAAALKVGYLQRSATGLWDVTSIGEIEAGGSTYLVAVLSEGNPSYDAGVELVNEVARVAVDAVT